MALRQIMLRMQIDKKKSDLEALRNKDAEFATREKELETAIGEANTEEEQKAVEEAVNQYDQEKTAHDNAKAQLETEIGELETELAASEAEPPAPDGRAAGKPQKVRGNVRMNRADINIRSLPMNRRAFDALPNDMREEIVQREDVKTFLAQLRSMKGSTRAIQGGELEIPVVFLDLISENMYRYSKLLNRVRVRSVPGQARQTIAGTVPEAVWTEMCGAINELTFVFNQITLDGYKVAGFVPVCNSLLEDTTDNIDLASWIIEMLSEAIGLAEDKAILYGKGSTSNMPLGIVTRLAQESQPSGYPANAPAWVDLHETNIIKIAGSTITGAEFWSALALAAGNTFTKYSRGNQFWAMNSKTYATLKSKLIPSRQPAISWRICSALSRSSMVILMCWNLFRTETLSEDMEICTCGWIVHLCRSNLPERYSSFRIIQYSVEKQGRTAHRLFPEPSWRSTSITLKSLPLWTSRLTPQTMLT